MAAKPLKTKELAQRIDPVYYRNWHRLRRARFLLSVGAFLAAALWLAIAYARGDRTVYASGPVNSSHRLLGEDCGRCHTEGFGPIYDAACYVCHEVGPHAPPGRRDPACAGCHAEHRGRERLTDVADGHCNNCHADHRGITSFGNHAQFRPRPREQHLKFNHAAHLDPGLVEGPLECGSCHWDQADARDFAPIRFDLHCARCHTDRLGPEEGVEVPHGLQPERLRAWVASVYVGRIEETQPRDPVPGHGAARAPAWTAEIEERTTRDLQALLQEGRGCLVCHVARDGLILRPRIPTNWLPRARFDHKPHRFEACATCHDMAKSTAADDLVLPPRHVCAECHKEGGAPTNCASCHSYHALGHSGAWR